MTAIQFENWVKWWAGEIPEETRSMRDWCKLPFKMRERIHAIVRENHRREYVWPL